MIIRYDYSNNAQSLDQPVNDNHNMYMTMSMSISDSLSSWLSNSI